MRVMEPQEVHPQLWKGANRKFAKVPWRKIELERHNADRTPEQQASCRHKTLGDTSYAVVHKPPARVVCLTPHRPVE